MHTPKKYTAGFTLIEMLVVGVILIILSSATIYYATAYQERARDQKRVADIQKLQTIFVNYAIGNGGLPPDCLRGITIDYDNWVHKSDSGSPDCDKEHVIKNLIAEQFPHGVGDPKGPGDPDYFYYYTSRIRCEHPEGDPPLATVVFAANLESQESNVNRPDGVCHDQIGFGNVGGYERTSSIGGSINPSRPYVGIVDRKAYR